MTLIKSPLIYQKSAQYPGAEAPNATVKMIKDWTKRQKKIKGYNYTIAVGATQTQNQLPGVARFLLGFSCWFSAPSNVTLSVSLNNELIVDTVNINLFNIQPSNGNRYQEFIPLNRFLSGQDQIIFYFQNNDGNAYTGQIHAHYI